MANSIQNNLWKFRKRILKYTENNNICLMGSFLLPHTVEQLIMVSYVVIFHTLTMNDTRAIVRTSVNDTILTKYLKLHWIFRKFSP